MEDGLYKVQFATPLGSGAGVVVLAGNTMMGGDSSMYYAGTYSQTGDQFRANVAVDKHTDIPGMASVFGIDHVGINLQGTVKGSGAEMTGTAAEAPGISFTAILTRIS